MSREIMRVNCVTGEAILFEDKLVINKKGGLGGKTENTIPLLQISSIEFRESGLIGGFIRFIGSGRGFGSLEGVVGGAGRILLATTDGNALTWGGLGLHTEKNVEFRNLKLEIEKRIQQAVLTK